MISRRGTNRLFWQEPHVRPEEPGCRDSTRAMATGVKPWCDSQTNKANVVVPRLFAPQVSRNFGERFHN